MAMNADQSELSIVKLESWLNRTYHELYRRKFKASSSEDILPYIIGKWTSTNLTLLHVKRTGEVAVNLVVNTRVLVYLTSYRLKIVDQIPTSSYAKHW